MLIELEMGEPRKSMSSSAHDGSYFVWFVLQFSSAFDFGRQGSQQFMLSIKYQSICKQCNHNKPIANSKASET